MQSLDGVAVPAGSRWLLRLAAQLAPVRERSEFAERWENRLLALCILMERGEVMAHGSAGLAALCRDAFIAAFWLRFSRAGVQRWMRGPQSVLTFTWIGAAMLAALSRGFQATREVIRAAIECDVLSIPLIGGRVIHYTPASDMVVGRVVPIAMALAIGGSLFVIGRLSVGRYPWRYWLYLAAKIVSAIVLLPLVWIEASHWLWTLIAPLLLRSWVAGIGATAAFLAGFGLAARWILDDQRNRCPVCLHRLADPVRMGSWSSMFEPVTTEMLCEDGHGALSVAESSMTEGDRWVSLDASWKGL
jgi:hypothetical protein